MTKQELTDNMREMVKCILPKECRDDKDIVENYTDTMVMISEEYHNEQLKLYNVSQQRELLLAYHKHLDSFNDPSMYNASESMIDEYLSNGLRL